ncbi:G5 domain family [Streptococcus pneumoniae]|uniref:G5 domain family n=3 Tax=Streptococcus pneumoniae TaxID=1313 RepID=A0ABC9K6T6_STREE|nr:YSIRK signal domain/LPXTG anchor domain surface protein [Streptococcus pneumoniae]EHD35182.1 LPXTG-motif cell wall anchor domain protein [Streptococcus pneumoniae GA44288]EHD44062.1 LPXTG-motif cell wall anchor domain protein [Streptococcus pneumoniae GA44452]EHD94490.1 LPXTG-motif cell wall anchor domain protein [Streptococcus pneumoniae GA14798]EHE14246.1 LPXTG-motif cell wall anchor domain protein [Streptococcus pneumoniae GA19077]EHE58377.1 LPXTG-motif cell wall anchor domain protein [S
MKHSHKKSFDWYSMQQRYSIRKYYFGAVSVLLGTALVLGAAASVQTVQAEENKQETTNSISVGRGEAATKLAEVSASNKEKTYAAPTVANPVETTPVKTGEVTKPAEKVEEAKDKKEEVTHQDAIDKSKLLTALSRAKKLESKLYTEASAANLQTSIQAGQSLLGKADASEAELSAAESSIQSSIIGLELRSNSNKGTVSETPVAKKANIVEAKEETNPAATTDRSAVDSAVLPTSTAAKVETTSAPASINEILKPGLSLSDARQNPAIRKEDLDKGYSGFRAAPAPTNKLVTNLGNNTVFTDISRGSHTFRGNGNSRGGNPIHFDVTTTRVGNRVEFSIAYSGPGEFVNNNFLLDKGNGFGEPSRATISTNRLRDQTKDIRKGANFVSHSSYSLTSAVETNSNQTIRFSLPIANPNGDLSVRLRPVTFNVGQGESGSATSNDPYSNSNYYFREKPLLLDANPNGGTNNKTVSEDIDFQTVYLPTSKLPEGQTRLVREGEKGQRQIIYKVHQLGNETILGLPISNSVIKEVKPRIMQIGVAKDLIDTVKPRVDQNKVGDTNNLTFYLDNDGNGVYTEGVDELVQKIAIKDGAKGEKGVQGERGLTGAQGQAGRDGVTPTVTVKDNKNDGTHTITINDGRGNVASTVVRDGFDGASPLVATQRNEADKTTTVIFYYDQNGNNELDASDKKLKEVIIADGAKGEQGLQGRDGAQGPKGEQGNPGTPGKDGKSLIAVKNGTETKVYVEDPARPGQPLNPNQPLATITDGRNGTNGQSPTITATRSVQNGKNGVLVTITPVGGRPQTTFVEDGQKGADGKTPTVTITEGQNGTHTLTVHNPGSPDVTTTIRDGATGQAGRDGKDVLNGKVNPQPNQGKNGDKYINTETGDVYVKNNGNWDKEGNIKGPKGDKGADGAKGEKGDQGERGLTGAQGAKGADGAVGRDGRDGKDVLNGKANPEAHQGKDGDKYVNTETGDVFVKNNGNWDKEGNIKGPKGDKGERGEDGKTPEVTVTPGKDGHSTDITFTVPGKDPVTVNVKDGENGLNGKTPKVDLLRVQGKNGNPSHTIVTFYTDENNDGKYTPGTDELLGSEMIKDGAKGADGRDGKSLLTVKDGKETKVYQEDPANPGQPLNPEKPLAVIRDGVDGKSPTVTAVRKDEAGHKGVEITVDNHDGSQPTTVFVQDGAKGETGAIGQDGQTPTITTQRGQDGQSTVVTITTPGKDPVTFTVKDGKNGKDGRAPKIKVEDITSPSRIRRATDAAATPTRNGIRVTVYDDVNDNGVYDGGVDKVLNSKDIYNGIDGRDGSAPTITTKDNGDGTHTITVQNPDGSESTTVVKDGKDGKTANITTTENPDGSHTITVTNPDGSTKETVVKNGKDGKTPKVEVTDNNDGTHTVKVTDGDGNVTNAIIKDGKDGKAATATTTENPDGSHTVTITNPDGTKNEFVVKNGRDGVDGRTPTASVRDNGDGSHTIVITNPEGVTTETTVRDGKSPKVTITDEQNGTHKISVLNGDGTTTETIIKDGKSPVATVRDNQDGTYTIRVENGNGTVSETTVRDGKSPTAKVVDNGDGTHTITVVNSDGTTTTTTVRYGREPKLEVIDNNDGSHTIKVTGADGKETTTTIFDGKSPKANIVDNGDGTHTLTIVDSDGREYKSIIKDGKDGKDGVSPTVTVENNNDGTHVVTITNPDGSKTEMVIKDGKDGKSPKVSVEDNGDGSHTITIINSDGTVTKTVIKDGKDGRDGRDGRDGKDGKCGCQDKPVTPSNDKPVPPAPNVPTPEVLVKPVPAQPTPNVPTPEVPVQPTPAVPTPEVPVPEQPVVPTPAQPATPVNANPVAPTTGKENRGDKLPETGSQSDYISVLLGSGILLSLYVGRRKED